MLKIEGEGTFDLEIVGESNYQAALNAIAGPKTSEGVELECEAVLIPEPSNPYDRNAVRVEIQGRTVGYLPRNAAVMWGQMLASEGKTGQQIKVDALITGGWIRTARGTTNEGQYGVALDIG